MCSAPRPLSKSSYPTSVRGIINWHICNTLIKPRKVVRLQARDLSKYEKRKNAGKKVHLGEPTSSPRSFSLRHLFRLRAYFVCFVYRPATQIMRSTYKRFVWRATPFSTPEPTFYRVSGFRIDREARHAQKRRALGSRMGPHVL